MKEKEFVTVDKKQLLTVLVTLGMKESEAEAWLGYAKERLCTIEDYQKDILDNTNRWFPNVYEDPQKQQEVNLFGIVGEAGEMIDVHKKWIRGSYSDYEYRSRMIEESIDLWHYLAQWWNINGVDVKNEYLDKTSVNEERFGRSDS